MSVDLRALAADLREARRYVRRHPVTAGELALKVVGAINDELFMPGWRDAERLHRVLGRLATNVSVGIKHVRSAPELLACYCETAAFECEILAGPVEIVEAEVTP